jgi:hypothetical protein
MRWVPPQVFLRTERDNERGTGRVRTGVVARSAVSARISRFRLAAARHVSALAVWHRRSGIVGVLMD